MTGPSTPTTPFYSIPMSETKKKSSNLYRLAVWYASTPLMPRRVTVVLLVPLMEYLTLVPIRDFLNSVAKFNPALAMPLALVSLFVCFLLAMSIVLFVIEAFKVKIKSRIVGWMYLACLFIWVFVPIHYIQVFERHNG